EGARDAIGPTERTRGVRALDDVVLRLRALGVAGETAARTQGREVLSAGQQLVHVALVTGVEHDRIARRVEDAVQRDRQLDDAEVRPEVPAGLGDLAHQELTDLPRELRQLVTTQSIEVTRTVNRLEQRHTHDPTPHILNSRFRSAVCARVRCAGLLSCSQTRLLSTYCRMPPLR